MRQRRAGKKRPNQKQRKKSSWKQPRSRRESSGRKTGGSNQSGLSDKIIGFIYRQGGESDIKAVQQALCATRGDRKVVDFSLAELSHQRILHKCKYHHLLSNHLRVTYF